MYLCLMSWQKKDILVISPRQILLLPILDVNSASTIITAFSSTLPSRTWYIAGNDLGGTAAGTYIHDNPTTFQGLFLLGAYVSSDISTWPRKVISISGTEDILIPESVLNNYKKYLPVTTKFYNLDIKHAGFGGYTMLPWDFDIRDGMDVGMMVEATRMVACTILKELGRGQDCGS